MRAGSDDAEAALGNGVALDSEGKLIPGIVRRRVAVFQTASCMRAGSDDAEAAFGNGVALLIPVMVRRRVAVFRTACCMF
jgi:hypothetical protein